MTPEFLSRVEYRITNETLEQVITGMKPKEGQTFLAICGSGDVPFALAEYGTVIAIDSSPEQIAYANTRKKFLDKGDHNNFLNPYDCLRRSEMNRIDRIRYFNKDRLEKIQKGELTFIEKDFLEFDPSEEYQGFFDGVYLSNIIGRTLEKAKTILEKAEQRLKSMGVIYVAEGEYIHPHHLGTSLTLDKKATKELREITTQDLPWEPSVFRKKE